MNKVLVLNADYTPLNVTDTRRGFILVLKGKAEIVREGASKIVTTVGEFARPIIIRLLNYIGYRNTKIRVTRKRILNRDGHACGYCGSKKNLTIDHIIPRSRGGGNTWDNLVTCCGRCNVAKGNRTPEEAGMRLKTRVYEPDMVSAIVSDEIQNEWEHYKKSFQ